MAVLHCHLRDYDILLENRRATLVQNSQYPFNWIAFGITAFLAEDYKTAYDSMSSYVKVVGKHAKKMELNEIFFFQVKCLQKQKKYNDIFELMAINHDKFLDKELYHNILFQCYKETNQTEFAKQAIQELIKINPENLTNYYNYFKISGDISFEQTALKYGEYETLFKEKFKNLKEPNCLIHIKMDICGIEKFKEIFEQYLLVGLEKGIPSLFKKLRKILCDTKKNSIVEEVIFSNYESLKLNHKLLIDNKEKDPTVFLWLVYFISQLYDYHKKYNEALQKIEEAIEFTPTIPELFMYKAKILKHMSNFHGAASAMKEAQELDQADRYINAKYSKYLIKDGRPIEAEKEMYKFLRDTSSDSIIHMMQCMWYEYEVACCALNKQMLGIAIKNLKYIEKHFKEYYEDQIDFHTYSLRRGTINAYLNIIEMEDNLYHNPIYRKAINLLVRTLLDYYNLKIVNPNYPMNNKEHKNEEIKVEKSSESKEIMKEEQKKEITVTPQIIEEKKNEERKEEIKDKIPPSRLDDPVQKVENTNENEALKQIEETKINNSFNEEENKEELNHCNPLEESFKYGKWQLYHNSSEIIMNEMMIKICSEMKKWSLALRSSLIVLKNKPSALKCKNDILDLCKKFKSCNKKDEIPKVLLSTIEKKYEILENEIIKII